MSRDYEQFPDDENGDALWGMSQEGDDLSIAREVDFAVIFATEDAALQFAVHLLKNEQKISFSPYPENEEFPWQVLAHPIMVPRYENISGFEEQLAEDAARFGGRNDGWGCYAQDGAE